MWKKLTIIICLTFCNLYGNEIKFLDSLWVKQKTEPFIDTFSDFYTPKELLDLNLTLIIQKDFEDIEIKDLIAKAEKYEWINAGTRKNNDGNIITLTKFKYKSAKVLIGFSKSIDNVRTTYWIQKEDNNFKSKRNIIEWLEKYISTIILELKKIQKQSQESNDILKDEELKNALNDPIRKTIFSDLKNKYINNKKDSNILIISSVISIIFIIFVSITTIFIKLKIKKENENEK